MAGYGTDEGLIEYLALTGRTLCLSDVPAQVRQRGSMYIDGLYSGVTGGSSQVWSGYPTGGVAQERAWPRMGATYYGQPIASDVIPVAVINASYEAGYWDVQTGNDLDGVIIGSQVVKSEKVDSIAVTYADTMTGMSLADSATPMLSSVYGLLKPFLIDESGKSFGIWSVGRGC